MLDSIGSANGFVPSGSKPLLGPMPTYCQYDILVQVKVEIES